MEKNTRSTCAPFDKKISDPKSNVPPITPTIDLGTGGNAGKAFVTVGAGCTVKCLGSRVAFKPFQKNAEKRQTPDSRHEGGGFSVVFNGGGKTTWFSDPGLLIYKENLKPPKG